MGIQFRQSRKGQLGFTLAELLIALSITAVIGVSISSMLHAVAYGSSTESDKRRVNTIEQVTCARITVAIRSSSMVLSSENAALVFWLDDADQNGRPNLSEIARLEWDSNTRQIRLYEAASDLSPGNDNIYDFSDDFEKETKKLVGKEEFPGMVWAKEVTAFQTVLDSPTPQSAKMVKYIITVQGKDFSSTATGIAALGTE